MRASPSSHRNRHAPPAASRSRSQIHRATRRRRARCRAGFRSAERPRQTRRRHRTCRSWHRARCSSIGRAINSSSSLQPSGATRTGLHRRADSRVAATSQPIPTCCPRPTAPHTPRRRRNSRHRRPGRRHTPIQTRTEAARTTRPQVFRCSRRARAHARLRCKTIMRRAPRLRLS